MLAKVVDGFTATALDAARPLVGAEQHILLQLIGHAEVLKRQSMQSVYIASDGTVTAQEQPFLYDANKLGFISRFVELNQIYDNLLRRYLVEEDFLLVTLTDGKLNGLSAIDLDGFQKQIVREISGMREGGGGSVIFSQIPVKIQYISRGLEIPNKLELLRREMAATAALPYSFLFGQPISTGRSGIPSNETDYQETIISGLTGKFVAAVERFRRTYAQ
jgi:hypothetical protein